MKQENMANDGLIEYTEVPLLYEKRVGHQTEYDIASYCDVHDLIATSNTGTGDITVYRINGQVAFTIKGRSDGDPNRLSWKPDGSLLGVGWTDGLCGVYSGENGRLLSQTSVVVEQGHDDWKLDLAPEFEADAVTELEEGDESMVATVVAWTAYSTPAKGGKERTTEEDLPETTEGLFDRADDGLTIGDGEKVENVKPGITRLADSITTLDVTKVLPQLSAIPSHGARTGPHGNKFATQAGVDSVFETHKSASDTIDTLISSGNGGYTNVLLDESVKIGSSDLQHRSMKHASHPQCSSQVILSDAEHDSKFRLHYIDLPLDALGSPLLHVIATNTKRVQNLMAYILQTVRCIEHDFTTGLQFPTRLMNNIDEELHDKEEGTLVTTLYQLAMTGSFTPSILEWLTDIIKETNHKRWDQAVSSMYANIRDHLFVNLLPALDRMSVACSTLRGHARLHEGTSKFDVPPKLFTTLLDEVDALRLVAQKTLLIVTAEYRQFRAFSKWLRVMIEVGIAGPGTKAGIETEEREVPNLDYSLLLAYIKETLNRSKLAVHVAPANNMAGACSKEDFFAHPIIAQMSRDRTVAALETLDTLKPDEDLTLKDPEVHSTSSLLNLPALTTLLRGQVRLTTDSITNWQSKMLPHPTTTPLITPLHVEPNVTILDLRMFPHDSQSSNVESVVDMLAASPSGEKSNRLRLYRIVRFKDSKKHDFTEAEFEVLDEGGIVLFAKLLDEKRAMVLYRHEDERRMLLECDLEAYEVDRSRWMKVLHVFQADPNYKPVRFIVGGRKGKMVCVVFGEHGQEWRIFDLESRSSTSYEGMVEDEMQF